MITTILAKVLRHYLPVTAILFATSQFAFAADDYPHAYPREGVSTLIDNDRVNEWKHGWEEGQALPQHMYDKDAVQVFYEAGRLQFTDAAGNVTTESFVIGDARFIPAGTVVTEMAVKSSPKAVTVELK